MICKLYKMVPQFQIDKDDIYYIIDLGNKYKINIYYEVDSDFFIYKYEILESFMEDHKESILDTKEIEIDDEIISKILIYEKYEEEITNTLTNLFKKK